MPRELMHGREGQIGLMLWCQEYDDIWEHFPLVEDSIDEMLFFGHKHAE